ncbi:hypothetical protein Dtox_2742 [Desulfofarcimen acetoxidans DSM 771]|uniref:Uncharacterized protein n=1 Tax=Desulfofarcimen acetoxidans (strain ATCC 49208 / DSM 771 / KCTC 5769 / VKM B-1644 / 5575) TaxID=485916 RepID=C8W1P9_DESAS|nr:hypothetical protein [Desulfofarcimen acetoxidans]ACV63520.1 hypothetical protein Dtox_2742 [Desulfofarcimen acetoxidans DSM 771]
MRIITNSDQDARIKLEQYELFVVEISYNPTTGVHLSGPSFQKIKNAIVINETYYSDNPKLVGSPGKMVYLMMATVPVSSTLYWFFSSSNYVSEFNFKLVVLPQKRKD